MLNNSCSDLPEEWSGFCTVYMQFGELMKKSFEERLQEISGAAELKAAKGLLKSGRLAGRIRPAAAAADMRRPAGSASMPSR